MSPITLTNSSFVLPEYKCAIEDLTSFKVESCPFNMQHNHKHCKYYHSNKDRRRKGEQYRTDLCAAGEADRCSEPETCLRSHNRVERLYHSSKFKMKFCTLYPGSLEMCEYGSYCSFAHSVEDIKINLVHELAKNPDFFLYFFKDKKKIFFLHKKKIFFMNKKKIFFLYKKKIFFL